MELRIKGSIHEKIGWYDSIFTRNYLVARAVYDAKIRNWNISFKDRIFSLEDSTGDKVSTFINGDVQNCSCGDFIENQYGTCMHIECIRILSNHPDCRPKIRECLQESRKEKNLTYIDSGFKLQKKGTGSFVTPSVDGFLMHSHLTNIGYFEKEVDNFDVFKDYGINLFGYQKSSVEAMIRNKRTVLSLKMGLGKTICALACIKIIDPKKVIIIAPNSLKFQWKREIERFELGSAIVISNGKDLQLYHDQKFLIMSYEMLNSNREVLGLEFDVLIADEIQKIKNPESVSWKTMSMVKSDFTFALSGTPIQNSIEDIVSVINFLNPHELRPQWKFYQEYCSFSKAKMFGIKQSKIGDFRKRIARYIINPEIDWKDFPLPKKKEFSVTTGMSTSQKSMHDGYLNMARPLLAKAFNYTLTFGEKARLNSLLTLARMSSIDTRLIDPNGPKSDRFAAIEKKIEEIASTGKKVVVFSEWIKCLDLIKASLDKKGIQCAVFTGKLNAKNRDRSLVSFINDKDVPVFLSTDSGGLGIDGLQLAANNIIHVEKMWNPMKISQRNGRLVRNLQKEKDVNVFYFETKSEIEHMMDESKHRKMGLIHDILGK